MSFKKSVLGLLLTSPLFANGLQWDTQNYVLHGTGCDSNIPAEAAKLQVDGGDVVVTMENQKVVLNKDSASTIGRSSCSLVLPLTVQKGYYIRKITHAVDYTREYSDPSRAEVRVLSSYKDYAKQLLGEKTAGKATMQHEAIFNKPESCGQGSSGLFRLNHIVSGYKAGGQDAKAAVYRMHTKIETALCDSGALLEIWNTDVSCDTVPELFDAPDFESSLSLASLFDPDRQRSFKPAIMGFQTGSNFAAKVTGYFKVVKEGKYKFKLHLGAVDNALVELDGTSLFPKAYGCFEAKPQRAGRYLTPGVYPISILFWDDGWSDEMTLKVLKPGGDAYKVMKLSGESLDEL